MLYYVISLRLILVYHTRTVSNDSVKVIQYLRLQQFYKGKVRFLLERSSLVSITMCQVLFWCLNNGMFETGSIEVW